MTLSLFDDTPTPDKTMGRPTESSGTCAGMSAENMFGIVGEESLGRALDSVFEQMEIAETRIEEFKTRHPGLQKEIHDAFSVLRPSELVQKTPTPVYRAHADELLRRIVEAGSVEDAGTEVATDAECLVAISEASLRSPLPREATWAFVYLMESVFENPEEKIGSDVPLPSPSSEWDTEQRNREIREIRSKVTPVLDRA